jgi:hypothetical protein
MAEVTKAMIHGTIEQLKSDVSGLKDVLQVNSAALNAMRTHMIAQSQDIQNIHTILARHDARLARIERRLEIVEPA